MALIKNGQSTDDMWTHVTEDTSLSAGEALPHSRAVIIPLARWLPFREAALAHDGAIGISVEPDDDLAVLLADIDCFDMIAVSFPTFKDGRGFSTARLLRERHGFRGELRATGHVLYDQLQFLSRCGFDAVDLPGHLVPQDWREALGEISVFYQPTGDGRKDVVRLRHEGNTRYAAAAE